MFFPGGDAWLDAADILFFCRYERPVGLLLTLYVHVVYTIALKFEGYAPSLPTCHVRSADTTKTVHRHDLLQAIDIDIAREAVR